MFVREKHINGYTYLYLVESVREEGRAKQRIIKNLGRKEITAIRSDVLDADARFSLFDRIKDEFGHLDILFANAGIAKFSPIEETREKDFDDVLRSNVTAVFLTVQAALRLMGPGASIILNGSMAATTGSSGSSANAASKAGVRAMCRSLAGDLSARRIRVNASFPALSIRRSGTGWPCQPTSLRHASSASKR
jgi:NAD(P)-dependent dehydrogenase (short-subunit alcohol dehydrogenase family)